MIEDRDYMREPEKRPVRADWPSFSVLHLVLVLNVVIFLVGPSLLDLGGKANNREVCEAAGFSLKALAEGRFWTLITHMFVHSGPLHLIGNLVIIFLAGNRLIQLLGSRAFLLAYFVGGIVGAAFQVTVDAFVRGANDLSVAGASAGACALGFAAGGGFASGQCDFSPVFSLPGQHPLLAAGHRHPFAGVGAGSLGSVVNDAGWMVGWECLLCPISVVRSSAGMWCG